MSEPNFMSIHPVVVEEIPLETTNVILLVALQEKSGGHQSHEDSFSENQESLHRRARSNIKNKIIHLGCNSFPE